MGENLIFQLDIEVLHSLSTEEAVKYLRTFYSNEEAGIILLDKRTIAEALNMQVM